MTPAAPALDRMFWRGFPALLLAFAMAQLLQQLDVAMLARLGAGGAAAYVVLTRLALADLVGIIAVGSVISVTVAAAVRAGEPGTAIRRSLGLAVIAGAAVGVVGAAAYPPALPWVTGGEGPTAGLAAAAIPWFTAAAPFRMVNSSAAFILHALGEGRLVVRWKLSELAAKLLLNLVFLHGLDAGFAGCFQASLLLHAGSAVWALVRIGRLAGGGPVLPPRAWAADVLRKSAWEAQRVLSTMLLGLVLVTLFASPLLAGTDPARLDAFAVGSALAMLVLAPFNALLRFLAMRFAGRDEAEIAGLVRALMLRGVPALSVAALLLMAAEGWIGATIYAQGGPWWSGLVVALALSLPIRVAANATRAALQATGRFGGVARIDSALGWGIGLPVAALGLYWDAPAVAYAYLVLPEAAALLWLGRRWRPVVGPVRRVVAEGAE